MPTQSNRLASHCAGRRWFAMLALLALALLPACRRGLEVQPEYAWVSAPQVNLRDRLAALYAHVGTVRNGDRLEVLERQKRFLRVRTAAGQEGWIEQRYVVGADVYQGFQKLASQAASAPVQGRALARTTVNIHLTPARDSEHLYQIKEGDKLELIKRGTGEKPGTAAPAVKPKAVKAAHGGKAAAPAAIDEEPLKPALEDWWLVRDHERHAGWVLARMLDLDVPLEIAQYAEGQRIVGAFALNQVYDPAYEPPKEESAGSTAASGQPQPSSPPSHAAADPHRVSQYVVALSEPKDGLPFDYNQVRVFTWNLRRHRYETAYRERNLVGQLPITVGEEGFGKEGRLPTFTLRVEAEGGQMVERKYKLNGPIVRRVAAAGEPGQKLAHPEKPVRKARKARKGRKGR